MTGIIAGGPRSADGAPVVAPAAVAYSDLATRFVGALYQFAEGTSDGDLVIDQPVQLQGGSYWVRGATAGDRVSLSVVDAQGQTLVTYVEELPVAPWDHAQDLLAATAGKVPAGATLRVTYTHTGSEPALFGVTYRWYV